MKEQLGWWGWGVGLLCLGAFLALIARWLAPDLVLKVGFQYEPAVLVLFGFGAAAVVVLVVTFLLQRQERKWAKALHLQQAAMDEERHRFYRRLDHEMKNPLTAIQVQLDNLQETAGSNAGQIAEVRAQADRLVDLTRGLRRLAFLETRELEIESVDVEELLGEVVEFLQAPDRLHLDVQRLPWALPPIQGDRELLLLAFRNLAHNALRYSEGSVEMRARHTAGHLVVEVIDTGCGIPADEIPLVTEELYRASNVHETSGSGLGLAMVQRIVDRHGGRLELRSRTEQGTIATVEFPYA